MSSASSGKPNIRKVHTGISGLDTVLDGGLPEGRVSVFMGPSGAGKTVFAMHSLMHLIESGGAPGMLVSFEQPPESVLADMAGFTQDAYALSETEKLIVMDARPSPELVLVGKFDISGLLAIISDAAARYGVKYLVLDGIDAVLSLLTNTADQRGELIRLQGAIRELHLTAITTVKDANRSGSLFEDTVVYMSDCVVAFQRESSDGTSRRSLQVVKYRGSRHIENWVPFLISERGPSVEVMDLRPEIVEAALERLSSGVDRLDDMLGGGLLRASSTLLSGAPGTAKTTLAALFIETQCKRGERCLCICFDEAPGEIVRNVASVGVDLRFHMQSGLLEVDGLAAGSAGPDTIAQAILSHLQTFKPRHLMIDPVSTFDDAAASQNAIRRVIQHCKRNGITVMLTSLLERGGGELESSKSHVSTLCDNWIHLSYVVSAGERNRALTIIKSRGTRHSNQVAELVMTETGITVADVYVEAGAVLMGSLRWQKERSNRLAQQLAKENADLKYRESVRGVDELSMRLEALSAELESKKREMDLLKRSTEQSELEENARRSELSKLRLGQSSELLAAPDKGEDLA